MMQELDFYHLIKYYAKHWRFVLILSLIGFIGGLVYNGFIQVPKYKSSATLIIIQGNDSSTTKNSTLINNYIELFKSRKVLEPTIKGLNLDESYDEISKSISAVNDDSTEVVKLSMSSNSPEESKKVLNYAIDKFEEEGKKLYKKDNIQIVDSASLESKPYNVNASLQLLVATTIGLITSVVSLFIIYDYQFYKKTKDDSKNDKEENVVKSPSDNHFVSTRANNTQIIEPAVQTFCQPQPVEPSPTPQNPTSIIDQRHNFNIPDRRI